MSHAAKLGKSEGHLDFREGARTLHNKVSAIMYTNFSLLRPLRGHCLSLV